MNSSSSLSSVFFPTICVSDDEFNLFHNIDRMLYQTLVLNLQHEPNESMQVMALWLWIEHEGHQNGNLIANLLKWPESLVNAVADETVMCLNCIESDNFPYPLEINHDLQLLENITNFDISLMFFHENRIHILRGVTKIMNTVCLRAFRDIWPQALIQRVARSENFGRNIGPYVDNMALNTHANRSVRIANPSMSSYYYTNMTPGFGGSSRNQMKGGGVSIKMQGFDTSNVMNQNRFMNHDITETFGRMQLDVIQEEEEEVQPDERTIFLTFSKGYPISENEIRDFFTRKCGNCVEGIYMQEGEPTEQPLFARLVVHQGMKLENVLGGHGKAKFTINGKHVWARKYVPKNPRAAPVGTN